MYLFHKKTKVLRVLALLCAFALGLCMTGGFQMTEAKTTYYDHRKRTCKSASFSLPVHSGQTAIH